MTPKNAEDPKQAAAQSDCCTSTPGTGSQDAGPKGLFNGPGKCRRRAPCNLCSRPRSVPRSTAPGGSLHA